MRSKSFESSKPDPLYLTPSHLGSLKIPNRLVRAATSESMAHENGSVSERLINFYTTLAKGQAGLLISGHMYIEPRGQSNIRQIGIHDDEYLPGLRALTKAVL